MEQCGGRYGFECIHIFVPKTSGIDDLSIVDDTYGQARQTLGLNDVVDYGFEFCFKLRSKGAFNYIPG